ncbi:MAG: anthranilate synthase component I family protein [Nitrospirae bacterium]|nr:anthranilate synthase component I family protein [Nitrospirota bacterium]
MNARTKADFLNNDPPGSLVKPLPWNAATPVSAYERIANGPYSFLLESIKGVKNTARYSFVGTEPFLVLKTKGAVVEIKRRGKFEPVPGTPLTVLKNLLDELSTPKMEGLPPFFGGGVGLFSYDLARFFEKLPRLAKDDLHCPDLLVMFVDTVIAFDHEQKTLRIIYTPPRSRILNTDRKALLEEGLTKIAHVEKRLLDAVQPPSRKQNPLSTAQPESNFTKAQYLDRVRRCKEYIAAGDIYQANLSQRFSVPFLQNAWSLYKALREINPSPFAGFLQMEDLQLVSASPERLIRLQGGVVETRPIAGTRPRGRDPREDQGMRIELLASDKERAEHLMLVDLERNDLGKVCRYGSVCVDEFMATEQYSHVIHIVSNIRGELSGGRDALDVIRAVFPGGTITGVPKIRCMEIIEELEPVVRGPYTGSFGYISLAGELDLNLIIRTFVIKNNRAYVQVGGGIVADSEPEREYQETLYKAEALLNALKQVR